MPAALSLATPTAAQAQTIITLSQSTGINLAAYGTGPLSIASGVSLTSTGPTAAVSDNAPAQLSNAGVVSAANGTGIYLGAGGTLTNSGAISGADAVSLNAAGSVANSGSINGVHYGVVVNNGTGQLANTGAIAAGYDGVSLNKGGSVTNSGSIFGGHIGVYTGNALGSVVNSGTISARGGDAVSLYSGGSLTNSATGAMLGGYAGVYAGGSGSHITNAGLVTGAEFGAYLMGASSISNSGTLAGGIDGVNGYGAGAVISNSGLIHGGQTGVRLLHGGNIDNSGIVSGGGTGVQLGANGTLANEASGHVTGGTTGIVAASGDVLRNDGTISGATGIQANGAITLIDTGAISSTAANGTAISLAGGASNITLDTGAQINGAIAANGTASQITLAGSGTLAATLTGFAAGSALTVQPGAVWAGSGQWQVAQLVNSGVFTPGAAGTPLSLTGDFVQTPSGTLRVLVTPAGISPFAITGTATLGGTLKYVLAPGTYAPANDIFLTAGGGISGNFAQVSSSQTGLTATPLQNGHPLTGAAGAGPVVQLAGSTLSITGPAIVAPAGTALFADSTQAMALGAFASGQALLDHAGATGAWAQATGDNATTTNAYSLRGGGFLAGLGFASGLGGRIGLAIGYDTQSLADDVSGTARLQTIRLGLYAAQPLGRFVLSGDIMGGIISRHTTRITGADAATAKGSANSVSGDVQLALPLSADGAAIVPAFGLRIASITAGPLDETSATQAFAVNAAAAGGTSVAPYLRMSVQKTFVTSSNFVITPSLGLGVSTMLNNPGANTQLTTQDGTIFTAHATHLAPIAGEVGAGIGVSRGNWSITARYTGAAGGNWSGQSLQAGVQVRF